MTKSPFRASLDAPGKESERAEHMRGTWRRRGRPLTALQIELIDESAANGWIPTTMGARYLSARWLVFYELAEFDKDHEGRHFMRALPEGLELRALKAARAARA